MWESLKQIGDRAKSEAPSDWLHVAIETRYVDFRKHSVVVSAPGGSSLDGGEPVAAAPQ